MSPYLLLTLPGDRKLLVKQERHNPEGKAAGEFLIEWRIQEFLQQFSNIDNYRSFLPELLHFDIENSIIVFSYSFLLYINVMIAWVRRSQY